jgi:excisionase family DNA binding protein
LDIRADEITRAGVQLRIVEQYASSLSGRVVVTMSGYRTQGHQSGEGYRLDKTEVVQKGRRRELFRTALVMLALYAVQLLLFLTATGRIESEADLGPVVPGRLSLLVDLACIVAQLFVAFRARDLVRSRRCGPTWLRLSQLAVALVLAGSLLDFVGDVRLWFRVDSASPDASLTLTFNQALWREPASTATPWFTVVATAFTIAGVSTLLAQAVVVEVRNKKNQPPLASATTDALDGAIICCSGSGIRATAFSLGGLQVLQREGIYQDAVAVVGVSGGGYIAAAQHVLRWNPAEDGLAPAESWDLKPPGMQPFALGSPEIQWLRRHTRYVLDSLGALTQGALSLAFGIAVNLLLVVVAIGSAAWLLAWLFLASGRMHVWDGQNPDAGIGGAWATQWAWVPAAVYAVPILGIGLFVFEKCIDRFGTPSAWLRQVLRKTSQSLITTGVVLIVLILLVPRTVETLSEYAAASDSPVAALLHQASLVPDAICKKSLEANGVGCGLKSTDLTPRSTLTVGSVSIFAVVSSILAVLASAKSAATSKDTGLGLVRGLLVKVWGKVKDPLIPYLAATIIVVVGVCFFLREVTRLVGEPGMITAWNKALVLAALLLFARVFTDANRTSMHYFFRERIFGAFFLRRTKTEVQPIDYKLPLRFSQAKPLDGGPRLCSCAVANVSDQELVPSQRGCTPFIFGHSRIGLTDKLLPDGAARRVSSVYEFAADDFYRDATIPAAVAISAAAFAPLAGRENVRVGPYRLVLALGNARLGVWLPNPIWIDEPLLVKRMLKLNQLHEAATVWANLDPAERDRLRLSDRTRAVLNDIESANFPQRPYTVRFLRWHRFIAAVRGIFDKPGMFSLIKEAIGRASIYDRFLYITDGGHYDKLGLIEALRRKPTKIYVLDASNDPEDTFRALGRAIATARMDLDCDLVMDPRGMRRLAQTRSGAAWCVGTYSYPRGRSGKVYLAKAVLPEGIPWDIETYALENKDFPSTSTGKHLYNEFDFEAYRELGSSAVRALLNSEEYCSQAVVSADSRFLSTKQAAEYLGVHPKTIHNWIAKGKIKAHRSPGGRLLRFDRTELDAAHFDIDNR